MQVPHPSPDLLWVQPAWRAEAMAWIDEQLARLRTRLSGELSQPHVRWWSTVMRVPTCDGVLWFKANRPEAAWEGGLTRILAARWPERTAQILAVEPERGWSLARDAGARLREVRDSIPPVRHWEQLLPEYAEVQIAMAELHGELLRLGVPDFSLALLPDELEATLDEPEMLLLDSAAGLSSADRRRLLDDLPAFRARCAELTAADIPETLQHDDLHDGNAFVRGGRHVVFDWGDACVTHPFHSLVVTLRALCYARGWKPGGRNVRRLRDAYLEAWQAFGAHLELVEVAELARATGTVQRAMSWRRTSRLMPPDLRAQHADSVAYGLRLYLLGGPWGTWDDGSF